MPQAHDAVAAAVVFLVQWVLLVVAMGFTAAVVILHRAVTRRQRRHWELERAWRWTAAGLMVWFRWRSKREPMGRFGGGWNWALGFKAGRTSLFLQLLVLEVGLSWPGREYLEKVAAVRGGGQ